jgi:hypothetical protein
MKLLNFAAIFCEQIGNGYVAQVIRDEKRNLFLQIDKTPISQWFKEKIALG